jgi:hypothetical protein
MRRVKIHCYPASLPEPPEVPIRVFVRQNRTIFHIRRMLQSQFLDGPVAAARCHEEYRNWERANAMKFFQTKDPLPNDALKWKGFLDAWTKEHLAAEDRGVMHAHVHADTFDFTDVLNPHPVRIRDRTGRSR